jgi:glycosyltransferase involved in cell wall biosynthesis
MKWYQKYLSTYNKPFNSIHKSIKEEIKSNLAAICGQNPLASLVIIAYNEEQRITSCIWSLSCQLCNFPIEIICIDNNSTDETAQIANIFGVKCFKENKPGPGYARDRGLKEAKGKYYICIDADTIYPPDYVEIMVKKLRKNCVIAVSSSYGFIPLDGYRRNYMVFYELLRDIYHLFLSIKSPELCVRGSVFAHYTAEALEIGYRGDLKRGEDGMMALELMKKGRLIFVRARRARAMTSPLSLEKDGDFFYGFRKRVISSAKRLFRGLFKKL